MGRVHERIDDELRDWVGDQALFFVATAPSGSDGHVNVSPKGMVDTFAFVETDGSGPAPAPVARCAYLDLTGSGAETIAHLRDNGRITRMWCAFEGAPRIVRFHGTGRIVLSGDDGWDELLVRFGPHPGARAVIVVDVARVSESCGYAVPFMDLVGERSRLDEWASARTPDELAGYRERKNAVSIDGLPALGD